MYIDVEVAREEVIVNMKEDTVYIHEKGPGTLGGRSTRALSISRLLDIKGFRAIDLGANAGYNSFDLYECGCREVLGIEVRDNYLALANEEKTRLGYKNVKFLKADVRKIDEMNLGKFDVCLCSGLLYHMQNPFNLLKRIRNICRYLAVETHISPSLFNMIKCTSKYRKHLTLRKYRIMLDGIPFSGRLKIFPETQDMLKTSGSVVSRVTFWLDKKSLVKAIESAGFRIMASYFDNVSKMLPNILIDYGCRKTKGFILAEVKEPDRYISAGESKIIGCKQLTCE